MYDKLGDMLNDFLETGRMPPKRTRHTSEKPSKTDSEPARDESGGPVIPDYLLADFYLLGFTRLTTTPRFSECKKAYRRLVKVLHPDTSGGRLVVLPEAAPQAESLAQKKRLTELVEAFKRITAWYKTG